MQRVYAEQRGASGDTEHNKFIELIDDGTRVLYRWGAIGQDRPPQVLANTPDAAVRKACSVARETDRRIPHDGILCSNPESRRMDSNLRDFRGWSAGEQGEVQNDRRFRQGNFPGNLCGNVAPIILAHFCLQHQVP